MNTDGSRGGSAREEAERLIAAGLAVASTALRGAEANRQLRGFAEQMLGSDRVQDLTAGLAGFVNGVSGLGGDHAAGPSATGQSTGTQSTGTRSTGTQSTGTRSTAGPSAAGFSTGSADCCVCPVCRLIAAVRDPSPEFAERLASAAGDLAVGMSGLLRALSGVTSRPGHGAGHDTGDDPWRAATTAPRAAAQENPVAAPDAPITPPAAPVEVPAAPAAAPTPKPVAKKAVAKKAVAKKAVAKKAVAKEAAAGKPAAEQTPATQPGATQPGATQPGAKKPVAKKTVAKKAVRKAVPRDPDDGTA